MTRTFGFTAVAYAMRLKGYCSIRNGQRRSLRSRFAETIGHNFGKALSVMLIVSLLATSTPAAPQTIVGFARDSSVSFAFWFRTSGWQNVAARILQGQRLGDRKQEKQQERDARISRLEIYPGNLSMNLGERVQFSAVAYDSDNSPVGGVETKWNTEEASRGRRAKMSRAGEFEATRPGTFTIVAEAAGRTASVKVEVRPGVRRNPDRAPEMKRQVSSRNRPATAATRPLPDSNARSASQYAGSKQTRGETKKRGSVLRAHPAGSKPTRVAVSSPSVPAPPLQDEGGWDDSNYWSAFDPGNTVGDPPGAPLDEGSGSGNFQIATPVLSLPGRGIDIALNLNYNSRVWNKAGNQISFDNDRGWPAPGFSLGFGKLMFVSRQNGAMLVDADGTRHGYSGEATIYPPYPGFSGSSTFVGHTTDGTFIDYWYSESNGALVYAWAKLPNGTTIFYTAQGPGAIYPSWIEDANGNHISISYLDAPRINTITDTLGRVTTFHYGTNNLLTAITGPGLNNTVRTLVRLHYHQLTLNYSFSSLTPVVREPSPWVLDAIYYPGTSTGFWFGDSDSYSTFGMLAKVSERRNMGFSASSETDHGTITSTGDVTREEVYGYPLTTSSPGGSGLTDAPTYPTMTERWTRDGTTIDQAVTSYSAPEPAAGQPRVVSMTLPNGTKSVQYSHNSPGTFLDGLVYYDETLDSGNNVLQSSTVQWAQGNYDSPRPIRVEKKNGSLPITATELSYGTNLYNQVTEVRNYDYGGAVLLNATRTQYQNSTNYTNRHIFNLPLKVEIFASDNATRVSQVDYQYDGPGTGLQNTPGVIMHSAASDPYTTEEVYGTTCCLWASDESGLYCEEPCLVNAYNPATDYRGNLTQSTTYSNAGGTGSASGAITETSKYDITGNLVAVSSSCCEQTTFNYTVDTKYGYPVSQTRGSVSDPYAQVKTSLTYDFNTGLSLSTRDANNRLFETEYYPGSLRPQILRLPSGAHSDFVYDDPGMSITETSYLESHPNDNTIASQNVKFLSGRGQLRQEKTLTAPGIWDIVDAEFGTMGQIVRQSRPYRSGTPQWTNFSYDALGRQTKVVAADYTLPDLSDGSTTESFYNEASRPSVATSAPGETLRIRDAWGRERWGRTDAQGRLVEVVEPNPAGNGSVLAAGALLTTYTYDTVGNLTGTSQAVPDTQLVQTRAFKYDSLGRVVAQKLAEMEPTLNDAGVYQSGGGGTWSDVFKYDLRSNLVQRIDARGVKKNLWYFNSQGHSEPTDGTLPDPLNRLQSISFDTSGDPNHNAQPGTAGYYLRVLDTGTISYSYRTKNSPTELKDITQLSGITVAGDSPSTRAFQYDTEGRVVEETMTLGSRPNHPWVTTTDYDTLDRLTDITYPVEYGNGTPPPPRRVVHSSYDVASRSSGLTVGGASHASNIVYNAANQITSLKIGLSGANQITENYTFNAQTGLLDNQTVVRGASTTLLNLSYDYLRTGTSSGRTGQVTKIVNNANSNKNRGYVYDALGRLAQATGGDAGAPIWTQSYTYDRFGNRTNVSASGYSAKLNRPAPPSTGNVESAMAADKPAVLPASNTASVPGAVTDETSAATPRDLEASRATEQLTSSLKNESPEASRRSIVRSHHAASSGRANSTMPQGSPPPTFTDPDLLAPGGIPVKALHITELRSAINALRARLGMSAFSWQTSAVSGGAIKADPIQEMRTALDQAIGAPAAPGYSAGLAQYQPVLAVHIQELRNRVVAAWVASSAIPSDGLSSVSYDQTSNRINSAGFAYDQAGNQVRALAPAGGSQRFQYDAANRLMKVRTDDNQTVIASYTYSDSNQRLVLEEGSLRTYYACGGSAEYTESGASTTPVWSKSYIYFGDRLLSTLTPNGSGGVNVQYHHPDRLGTRLLTNAQDTNSFEQVTLPFGTALNAESGGATNKRFTSYDRSLNTGLDYANNRHYDPRQGRFTQVDPIGINSTSLTNPQTLNLYAYCANDPINHVDPSGLGFFSFLKKIFKKFVHALKAALQAFVVAFVGSGGDFRKAFRAGRNAFISDIGAHVRTGRPTGTPQWNPNAAAILTGGPSSLSRYIIWNFQMQDPVPDVITFWVLESASSKIAALMRRIKEALCRKVPRGRVSGVQGTLGLVGGPTGGLELVQNYRSGQVSGFAFGGAQAGWNGGASGNVSSGFVWGLNDSNSNYSGGFTGANGAATVGLNVQSSSGGLTGSARDLIPDPRQVTSVTVTAGASLIPTPTGGLTVTNYSKPLQMGKWWTQANPNWVDTPLIAANQACR